MEKVAGEERTFRQYTSAQAKNYAANRRTYHDHLFEVIFDHHRSTGGLFGTLLDVGCGPGRSTRPLAKHFDMAYGLDASPEMINTARSIGLEANAAETARGERIEFVVGKAEDTDALPDARGKVNLLTSATAV